MSKQELRLTPAGRTVLDATSRGQVRYLTGPQIVIQRLDGAEVFDVSRPFMDLQRARWAYVQSYDLEMPPVEVLCLITPSGEDALMEAAQRARKRKADR